MSRNEVICILGPAYIDYLCFEHTTYSIEWHPYLGPTFFRHPDTRLGEEVWMGDELDDHFLWGAFEEWKKLRRIK